MGQNWYIKQNGRTAGPVSVAWLKLLAGESKIQPDTPLRLGEQGEWVPARRVKGLLPSADPQPSKTESSNTESRPSIDANNPFVVSSDSDVAPAVGRGSVNPYQTPMLEASGPAPAPAPVAVEVDPLALRSTKTGLRVVYFGLVAYALALVCTFLGGIVSSAIGSDGLEVLATGVGSLCFFGGLIAFFVGSLMCWNVPTDGGKRLLQFAVIGQALAISTTSALLVVSVMTVLFGNPTSLALLGIASSLAPLLNFVFLLSGYVAFLFFLRQLVLFIGRPDLGSTCRSVIRWTIFVTIATFVTPFALALGIGFLFVSEQAFVLIILGVLALLCLCAALVTFFRYTKLVDSVSRAIPSSTDVRSTTNADGTASAIGEPQGLS